MNRRQPLTVSVAEEPWDANDSADLRASLWAELDERYAGEDIGPPTYDPADYAPPRGVFLVARIDGQVVGCGALRPGPESGTGEVKRMYVVPGARGRRIAEQVLAALLEQARGLGHERLVLETGIEQPEAMRLYERC